MKRIYLIGGPMGVGKTTTCQLLKKMLPNSVFLDGDWCWDANPFWITDETTCMVLDNVCYLLNNFIHCSVYENIFFCWVMHDQAIIDTIVERIDTRYCTIRAISLICHEAILRQRLYKDVQQGIRKMDVVERSIARLPLYSLLNTQKIDTSQHPAEFVADLIARL